MKSLIQGEAAPAGGRRRFGFGTVTSVMNSIGTVWVFVLLVIINLDIIGRAAFNRPIRGVPEVVSMSIVALVFLQIAHTTSIGRLTRSEMLLNWLLVKAPRLAGLLQGLTHLVGAGLMAVLFWATHPIFVKAWTISEYVGAEGDFKAPVWPVKLIILIGCTAGFVQFLLMAIADFRKALGAGPTPSGGPA